METKEKTTVQWVQDLIAIHITRKEAAHRLAVIAGKDSAPGAAMVKAGHQSQQFLPALLDELSSYGDAVAAEADRDNEYILLWNNSLASLDQWVAADAENLFKQMEDQLQKIYQHLLEMSADLPPSFNELLNLQWQQLKAGR